MAAVVKVRKIHEQVWPGEDGDRLLLSLDEVATYAQQLLEIFQDAEAVRLLWIEDILNGL